MNSEKRITSANANEEITSLLDILLKTGQRLEELTAGEIDTASDRDGRMLLLQGTQEQLGRSELAKQAAILNALPANIALLDIDGTIVSVNDSWRQFRTQNMQCAPGHQIGLNYLAICNDSVGDGSYEAHLVADGIRSVLDGNMKSFSLEYECQSALGRRWSLLTATPLADDRPSGVIVNHIDITGRKQAESELLLLAERLSLATAVAKVGVWEWDVTNNTLTWDATMFAIYGLTPTVQMPYEVWSTVVHADDLVSVETTLRRALTEEGEHSAEFRIVVADGTVRNISATARAVLARSGSGVRVIGVNVDVTERKKVEEDLRCSQARMTHLAEHDFLTDLPNRRVMHDRIDQAIKLALKSGVITGAEALLRWKHPTRGSIPPSEFIAVAEECGLIQSIGMWVLREACKQSRAWTEAGLPRMTMAVNVSSRQFESESFHEDLFTILRETDMNPRFLELEVTEGLLMTRPEITASILQTLRQRNVQIAIDDFGTGYSSLSYLHKFPLDTLKIDQSFVRQIATNPEGHSMVSSIINVGRSLKLRIVAEGVETAEELTFLQDQGCEEAQGYYFGHPVSPENFIKLIERKRRLQELTIPVPWSDDMQQATSGVA